MASRRGRRQRSGTPELAKEPADTPTSVYIRRSQQPLAHQAHHFSRLTGLHAGASRRHKLHESDSAFPRQASAWSQPTAMIATDDTRQRGPGLSDPGNAEAVPLAGARRPRSVQPALPVAEQRSRAGAATGKGVKEPPRIVARGRQFYAAGERRAP
jgi:hypothetical protein